jgi:hypothetical protein
LAHLPCNPELAASGYHLFDPIKCSLRGLHSPLTKKTTSGACVDCKSHKNIFLRSNRSFRTAALSGLKRKGTT